MARGNKNTAQPLLPCEDDPKPYHSCWTYSGAAAVVGIVTVICIISGPQGPVNASSAKQSAAGFPVGCSQGCATSFGSVLGTFDGVPAMSNCNSETCIADLWSTVDHPELGLPRSQLDRKVVPDSYGVQWQCVEYARRYWMLRGKPQPAAFGSVDGAADIWDLTDVQLLGGGRRPLLRYFNGNESAAGSGPRVGDLLIYPRQPGGFPYGHVAVVAGVTEDRLYVAEQNWDNLLWPGPDHNYSRAVKLSCSSRGAGCTVHESGNITLLGWVRY